MLSCDRVERFKLARYLRFTTHEILGQAVRRALSKFIRFETLLAETAVSAAHSCG